MRRIPHEVVGALIALGRTGVPGVPDCLADEQTAWSCLVRGKEVWLKVAKVLSEDELRHLIQGLVLYSRARGRGIGGSASPVIFLYLTYIARFPNFEPELTAWVVDNRVNDYEPFGSSCHEGARTYAEFLEGKCVPWGIPWGSEIPREVFANFGAEFIEYDEYSRRGATVRQRLLDERAQKLADAVRRGDLKAVIALLDKGVDPQTAADRDGSLVKLADANGRGEVAAYLRSRGIA